MLGVAASYKGWRVEGGGVSRLLHFKDSLGGWNNFLLDFFYVSQIFCCQPTVWMTIKKFSSKGLLNAFDNVKLFTSI